MARVAVFDSGLGSLSILGPLRRAAPGHDLAYLADSASFPYGDKPLPALRRAVLGAARALRERFGPDLTVVGSNTPSLLLPDVVRGPGMMGVLPPLERAAAASPSGAVAVLASSSVARGPELRRLAAGLPLRPGTRIVPVDASPLIGAVESGAFLDDQAGCARLIRRVLEGPLRRSGAGAAALSSTHLPLLAGQIARQFPALRLVDPGEDVARAAAARLGPAPPGARARLSVYTTGDPGALAARLRRLGISSPAERLR